MEQQMNRPLSDAAPSVPSTTEHSRSTFSGGRTVPMPSRPEVAEPHNRKLGGCESAPNRDPIQNRSMPRMLLGIPERRRNMRPNAQLFRRRRAHNHQLLARALCKQPLCPNAGSNTAPLPHSRWVDTADWPSMSGDIFRSLPGSRKSLSRHTFRSTSPAREALLSVSTAPAWVAARLGPERRACGGASVAKGDADPEDEDDGHQATPQTSKERRKVRYRRGEPAGSRPPAHTPPAHSAGSVKVHGDPDRGSSSAGGCCFQRYFQKHRTIEEHHAAAGGSGFTT